MKLIDMMARLSALALTAGVALAQTNDDPTPPSPVTADETPVEAPTATPTGPVSITAVRDKLAVCESDRSSLAQEVVRLSQAVAAETERCGAQADAAQEALTADLDACTADLQQGRRSTQRLNDQLKACVAETSADDPEMEDLRARLADKEAAHDIAVTELDAAAETIARLSNRLASLGYSLEAGYAFAPDQASAFISGRVARLARAPERLESERCAEALDWLADKRPLRRAIWVWSGDALRLCVTGRDGAAQVKRVSGDDEAYLIAFR